MPNEIFSRKDLLVLCLHEYVGFHRNPYQVPTEEIIFRTGIEERLINGIVVAINESCKKKKKKDGIEIEDIIKRRQEKTYGGRSSVFWWLVSRELDSLGNRTVDATSNTGDAAKERFSEVIEKQRIPTKKGRCSLKEMKVTLDNKKMEHGIGYVMLAHMINKFVKKNGHIDDTFFNKEIFDELKRDIEDKLKKGWEDWDARQAFQTVQKYMTRRKSVLPLEPTTQMKRFLGEKKIIRVMGDIKCLKDIRMLLRLGVFPEERKRYLSAEAKKAKSEFEKSKRIQKLWETLYLLKENKKYGKFVELIYTHLLALLQNEGDNATKLLVIMDGIPSDMLTIKADIQMHASKIACYAQLQKFDTAYEIYKRIKNEIWDAYYTKDELIAEEQFELYETIGISFLKEKSYSDLFCYGDSVINEICQEIEPFNLAVELYTLLAYAHMPYATDIGKAKRMRSIKYAKKALKIFDRTYPNPWLAHIYFILSYCYRLIGKYKMTEQYLKKACETSSKLEKEVIDYGIRARRYTREARAEKFTKCYKKYLEVLREEENLRDLANIYVTVGNICNSTGEIDNALLYYKKIISEFKKLVRPLYLVNVCYNLGKIYENKVKNVPALFDDALHYYKIGAEYSTRLGANADYWEIMGLLNIFYLYKENKKDYEKMREYYTEALKIYKETMFEDVLIYELLGYASLELGEWGEAKKCFDECCIRLEKAGPFYICWEHCMIGRMYGNYGKFDEALKHFTKMLEVAECYQENDWVNIARPYIFECNKKIASGSKTWESEYKQNKLG